MTVMLTGEALRAAQLAAREKRRQEGTGEFAPPPSETEWPATGADYTPLPLPDIALACVSRWLGKEPKPLEFAIEDLVPKGMVTLLVAQGGAGKSLLCQAAISLHRHRAAFSREGDRIRCRIGCVRRRWRVRAPHPPKAH